jgi:hypothetical protein
VAFRSVHYSRILLVKYHLLNVLSQQAPDTSKHTQGTVVQNLHNRVPRKCSCDSHCEALNEQQYGVGTLQGTRVKHCEIAPLQYSAGDVGAYHTR